MGLRGHALLLAASITALVCACGEPPRTLEEAARRGTSAQVVELITPQNVDRENAAGQTPLRIAAEAGNMVAVRALLLHGAKLEGEDASGRTALHLAARAGRDDVVNVLIRAGASWKKEDADGR